VGDSLRRSIDRGLAGSRFGIVVISPAFLSKEWPQLELEGLVAREVGGIKVILPVWHDISADEVRKHSPILAGRLAVSSKTGLENVVGELLRAMKQDDEALIAMEGTTVAPQAVPSQRTPVVDSATGEFDERELVRRAQFDKLSSIERFFAGKDEMGLRVVFDLPNILSKNIATQIIRLNFIGAGRENDFFYNNYSDNGSFIFRAKEGHFTTGASGVQVSAGPQDVLYLVTTNTYQLAVKVLVEFMNSALITAKIKDAIIESNSVVNKNTELMTQILDERMHQDKQYFLNNMEMGTPFYGVIFNDFARGAISLKPAADRVLSAISAVWKIN
jgi:hypothetical protein